MDIEATGFTIVPQEAKNFFLEIREKYPALQVIRRWKVGYVFIMKTLDQPMIIGRGSDASFCIPKDSVSRVHAKIFEKMGQIFIEDNNSTNGTIVNGEKVKQCALRPSDKIYIGEVLLRFDMMDKADITFSQELWDKIDSAQKDSLTGLLSKRYYAEELPGLIEFHHRKKMALAFLVCDIDHFKKINDTHGHQAGDYILSQVAKVILGSIRDFDLGLRYGGEEFVVVLTDIPHYLVNQIAERLRQSIEKQEFVYEGKKIPVTLSLGLTMMSHNDTLENLFQRADSALYRSKQEGRNRLSVA